MREREVEFRAGDAECQGVLYWPGDQDRWPGVLHLTDIGGIRSANREMARRVAAGGYAVLQPNVFYRSGRLPVFDFPMNMAEERTVKRLAELRAPLTPDAVERDATAYVDYLASQPFTSGGPMGVAGYCFTGAFALRVAATRPDRIRAAASFHGGGLFTETPASPHHVLPRIQARLYFAHASEDRSMPQDAIDHLNAALEAWGGDYESEVYDGAYHSWTVSDSPVFNAEQAERGFQKLRDLFSTVLSRRG